MLVGEKGEYTLIVQEDADATSPREDDTFGTMVCFHRRYNLGDEHSFENSDDFLLSLLEDTFDGDWHKAEQFRERVRDSFNPYELGWGAYDKAVDDKLLETIRQKHVILPLYLYDHSGITMNTTGFSCPWDSGQVGWIYASKDNVLKEYGGKNLTADKRERAENLLRREVEYYDSYLRDECYGFELLKNGETVDSCWGFIGDIEQVLDSIKEYLPDECDGVTENLAYTEERASVLDFLKEARSQIATVPVTPKREAIESDAR